MPTPLDWKDIATGPKTAKLVMLLLPDGTEKEGHWACDLSGEEQPAFRGWFTRCGGSPDYYQIYPTHWRPKD